MMTRFLEPLAFRIYRRHMEGETVQEIAEDLGLPFELVRRRLAAAALLRRGNKVGPERVQSPSLPVLRA